MCQRSGKPGSRPARRSAVEPNEPARRGRDAGAVPGTPIATCWTAQPGVAGPHRRASTARAARRSGAALAMGKASRSGNAAAQRSDASAHFWGRRRDRHPCVARAGEYRSKPKARLPDLVSSAPPLRPIHPRQQHPVDGPMSRSSAPTSRSQTLGSRRDREKADVCKQKKARGTAPLGSTLARSGSFTEWRRAGASRLPSLSFSAGRRRERRLRRERFFPTVWRRWLGCSTCAHGTGTWNVPASAASGVSFQDRR
jgi:hypothetical protein